MKFTFKQWVTKDNDFLSTINGGNRTPVPMRVMFGKVHKQTEKLLYVELYGKPEPSIKCLHCGRKLTHKVSQYYGIGPVCGKHFYITDVTEENLQSKFDEIRKKLADVTWMGWIPKSSVELEDEILHKISFLYNGKEYIVKTTDKTKVKEVYDKCDAILYDNTYRV